jgi:hypothetical protein
VSRSARPPRRVHRARGLAPSRGTRTACRRSPRSRSSLLSGDGARAAVVYDALLPYAERNASVGFAAGTFGACARYLGLLAATRGRLDDAVRHLADALAANIAWGAGCSSRTQRTAARPPPRMSAARTTSSRKRAAPPSSSGSRLLARIDDEGGARLAAARSRRLRRDGRTPGHLRGRTLRMKHEGPRLSGRAAADPAATSTCSTRAERSAAPVAGVGLHDQVRRDWGAMRGRHRPASPRAYRRHREPRRSSRRRRASTIRAEPSASRARSIGSPRSSRGLSGWEAATARRGPPPSVRG